MLSRQIQPNPNNPLKNVRTWSTAKEGEYGLHKGQTDGDQPHEGVGHALFDRLHPLLHQHGDDAHQGEHQGQSHQPLVQPEPGVLAKQLPTLE